MEKLATGLTIITFVYIILVLATLLLTGWFDINSLRERLRPVRSEARNSGLKNPSRPA